MKHSSSVQFSLPRSRSERPSPFKPCQSRRRPLGPSLLVVLVLLGQQVALRAPAVNAQQVTPVATEASTPATVNINTADAQELARNLTGVGGSKAEAIVRYREQFGAFESVEELAEVTGIGAATVERNRARIVLK